MTEPYVPYRWRCARCNRFEGVCNCPDSVPSAPSRALLAAYVELRREGAALEELIATGVFTIEESNRLDRGVTLMKVGFKLVKKVLRSQGLEGRLKPDIPPKAEISGSVVESLSNQMSQGTP